MAHRAQRRRNQEARDAAERQDLYIAKLPDFAEEKLWMPRKIVEEAVSCSGLVSVTLRPRGRSNYMDVYGGAITHDGSSRLSGDGIVNDWRLPKIEGFRVRYGDSLALVARLEPDFTALNVSNVWLRTADEIPTTPISLATEGEEEHMTITRSGLGLLAQSLGHDALSRSLEYIEGRIFANSAA